LGVVQNCHFKALDGKIYLLLCKTIDRLHRHAFSRGSLPTQNPVSSPTFLPRINLIL
jgi:hypothetical protein